MHNYLRAEISTSAIRWNFARVRERLAEGVQICAVIKANAYGHGQDLLLGLMGELADWLAVATPAEALHLRERGYEGPMLVFFSSATAGGENLSATLDELLARRVTLTVASRAELEVLSEATRRTGIDAKVHVMIDTGMTRSGILPADAPGMLAWLREEPAMRMTGVYTHLATADEADKTFAREQLTRFRDVVDRCGVGPSIVRHAANSAAVADLPESHFDMVRPGLALYGYHSSDELHHPLELRPSLRLTAHLMQIKTVPAGTRVGYGQTHEFTRDSRVGLVPVGYGDGYFRCLGNRAQMSIGGRLVPVVGRVSMDQTTVDLTDHPSAAVGDEVEIISSDPSAAHSLENLARQAETIPYEIMCRLGQRVRRFLVD
jgi:alanine racemase